MRGRVLEHGVQLDGNAFAFNRQQLQDHARSYLLCYRNDKKGDEKVRFSRV
jgi:hypothetical protein